MQHAWRGRRWRVQEDSRCRWRIDLDDLPPSPPKPINALETFQPPAEAEASSAEWRDDRGPVDEDRVERRVDESVGIGNSSRKVAAAVGRTAI